MPSAPDSRPSDWRSSYRALLFAEGLAVAAFACSMPVIPLYLGQLGLDDPVEQARWSGLILAAASAGFAVFAPIWGFCADRFGKRSMLVRAMAAGIVVVGLMAFVQAPWQLLVLRVLQGCLTGTVTAATVLMAGIVPKQAAGPALGMLTTAIYVGNSSGPLIGGLVADHWGARAAFLVTSLLLALSLAVLLVAVKEPPRAAAGPGPNSRRFFDLSPFRGQPALLGLLLAGAAINAAGSVIYPLIPLIVQSLARQGELVASTAGLVLGSSALSGALGALGAGRLGQRVGYARLLIGLLAAGALFTFLQGFTANNLQLLALRTAASAFIGGSLPCINALIALRVDKASQGGVYGINSSLSSVGNAAGPLLGGSLVAGFGLMAAFPVSALILALAAGAGAWFRRKPRPAS